MSPTLDACLRSWPWDPWLLATCVISVAVYWRGWRRLAQRDPLRWSIWRPAAFGGGVAALYLALASPIEPLSALLLAVHMVQHLLLIMAVPPLVWLGAPLVPILFGLPAAIRSNVVAPLLRSPVLRRLAQCVTRPVTALGLFMATNLLWHVPACYELALRSSGWHYVQHACFLAAGLVFWYPVIRPYPSRHRASDWLLLPCLLLADVQNTVLAALLTFSGKVLYPYYAQVPRIGNLSPLEDQSAAGVIMWVPGSIAFLIPLAWIGLRLMYGTAQERRRPTIVPSVTGPRRVQYALPVVDVRQGPAVRPAGVGIVSSFLRWRYARMTLQVPLLIVAMIVIYDGLRGPQASPLNLAGVLPWIHWRGFVVLGLLAVGNLSCMACPFTLPRKLAGRWLPQGRSWPRWLRSKWLAVALIGLFLWAYEAFALWDSPWWTAWIAIGYFIAAFAIDGFFRGAAFCKYVCPIGQFNFVQSLISPVEVAVYDHAICATCRTHDCIRGRGDIPGCQLGLFQPRKAGNMDCTFCLDCVQACPQANVGLVSTLPGSQLWHDRLRSGIGRFGRRPDIAALVVVLVFGAFANAAGMVRPVVELEQRMQALLGLASPRAIVTIYYLLALIVAPLVAISMASAASRSLSGLALTHVRVATRYAYALVPLGFGMWLAHYSFHFLTSYASVIPTTQRFAADLGLTGLGEPQWSCACCAPVAAWVLRAELLFLDFGFLISLYSAHRMATADCAAPRQAMRAFLPWAALIGLLFALGVWLVFQPMQMRGTMMIGG